jgi:hypothetical protein
MNLDESKTTIDDGEGLITYKVGETYEYYDRNGFIVVKNTELYAFAKDYEYYKDEILPNEHLFCNHFVILPEKTRVEELFEIIKTAQDELALIRDMCKHENHTEGLYQWRVGSVKTGQICDYCKEFLG